MGTEYVGWSALCDWDDGCFTRYESEQHAGGAEGWDDFADELKENGWLLRDAEDDIWLCPKHARIHLYGPDGRVEDPRQMETLELLEQGSG